MGLRSQYDAGPLPFGHKPPASRVNSLRAYVTIRDRTGDVTLASDNRRHYVPHTLDHTQKRRYPGEGHD